MRVAFVDLVFAWPPPGGAQADLYHVMNGLQQMGFTVHLFAATYEDVWRFGTFDPAQLPFPSTAIPFSPQTFTRNEAPQCFRREVEAWKPDVVFMGFGRFMKPYLMAAFVDDYPTISRYYMYEHLCLRGFNLWKEEAACPNDFLHTPNVCRRCALNCWRNEIRSGRLSPYSDEFLRTNAHSAAFHRLFLQTLRKTNAAIVNNELARQRLKGFCARIEVIPGGVHIHEYECREQRPKQPGEKKVILMSGRMDDPLKGVDVLIDAGVALSQVRQDFEVWVTGCDPELHYSWLKQLGWQSHSHIMDLYQRADICVVPSIWQEPFGLVAVEAMAAGLPVCASRVGGLQSIVRHGETGLLFEAEDAAELALHLDHLLSDPERCAQMGRAGRRRAEAEYDWRGIVPQYYAPLLESVCR